MGHGLNISGDAVDSDRHLGVLEAAPVDDALLRLGVVLLLGAAVLAVGRVALGVVLRRVRQLGTIGYA